MQVFWISVWCVFFCWFWFVCKIASLIYLITEFINLIFQFANLFAVKVLAAVGTMSQRHLEKPRLFCIAFFFLYRLLFWIIINCALKFRASAIVYWYNIIELDFYGGAQHNGFIHKLLRMCNYLVKTVFNRNRFIAEILQIDCKGEKISDTQQTVATYLAAGIQSNNN